MLVSKFSVSIIRHNYFNNLKNVLARCASKKCSNDVRRNCSNEKTDGSSNRCEENRKALVKCPKTTCKNDSPIVSPKVKAFYLQTLNMLLFLARSVRKFSFLNLTTLKYCFYYASSLLLKI